MRYGPQPYEGYLSDVCEAFGCLPDEAERQDAALVQQILSYRTAAKAVEVYRMGKQGIEILAKYPVLIDSLVALSKAQFDEVPEVDWERQIYGEMQAMKSADDEDEEN